MKDKELIVRVSSNIDEVQEKLELLIKTTKEAKSLADELASKVKGIKLEIEL